MNITFLSGDHGPTPFGLDAPHRGNTIGHVVPHAIAMGYLIEPVSGGYRPNGNGLK
jgi:hypothetical protein